ncbi:hypothetical protein [Endozoicomonas sp. ALD040]|uniref:hypothetical protein n=1 Tax=Endozoicomonas sp. ALD040 TaxID=3403079 RepID=UPI003BAEF957
MTIKAVRNRYRDYSPSVTVELTQKQLNAIYTACSELTIIRYQYYHLIEHPEQKKNIKMSVRQLVTYGALDTLEDALEHAFSLGDIDSELKPPQEDSA